MKYLRYALLGIVLILCVTVALANRDPVTLALWPDTMTAFLGFGYSVTLPLFAIVGGAAGLGLVFGLVWEWLREHRHRVEASVKGREVTRLERELAVLKDSTSTPAKDDILALLDQPKAR